MAEVLVLALAVRARARGDLSRRVHRRRDAVRAAARRARPRAGGPLDPAGAVPRVAEPLLSLSQRHRLPRVRLARRRARRCSRSARFRSRSGRGRRPASGPLLWLLYLSFVNVGQTFYGFGWETLLCEVGFFTIFAGASRTAPNMWLIWIWRWTLFRLMFGAGLIKLRGDSCWRDLTCLNYYFETQPMPNPLSWYFHWMPHGVHAAGVVINHIVEVIVPFAYFAPQPFASIAGIVTILFQGVLIVSGNLSWLNWLTLVLCIPLISDRWLAWLPVHPPADLLGRAGVPDRRCMSSAAVVALLSIGPVHEHAVAAADDERQLRSAAPGEHVRRVRQHHARALSRSCSQGTERCRR